MAIAAVVALRGLRRGVQQEPQQADARVGAVLPGEEPGADIPLIFRPERASLQGYQGLRRSWRMMQ